MSRLEYFSRVIMCGLVVTMTVVLVSVLVEAVVTQWRRERAQERQTDFNSLGQNLDSDPRTR